MIVHDKKPRIQWRLAIVEKLVTGNDDLIRAAHIRMENYRTTRPIVKLYPLEVRNDENDLPTTPDDDVLQGPNDTQVLSDNNNTHDTSSEVRVRREAASKALQKMSEWTAMLRQSPEDVGN